MFNSRSTRNSCTRPSETLARPRNVYRSRPAITVGKAPDSLISNAGIPSLASASQLYVSIVAAQFLAPPDSRRRPNDRSRRSQSPEVQTWETETSLNQPLVHRAIPASNPGNRGHRSKQSPPCERYIPIVSGARQTPDPPRAPRGGPPPPGALAPQVVFDFIDLFSTLITCFRL